MDRTDILQFLKKQKNWPIKYPFKFIVKNDIDKIQMIKSLLPNGNNATYKTSKNGKYVSVGSIAMMKTAEDIIYVYEQISEIEGIVPL